MRNRLYILPADKGNGRRNRKLNIAVFCVIAALMTNVLSAQDYSAAPGKAFSIPKASDKALSWQKPGSSVSKTISVDDPLVRLTESNSSQPSDQKATISQASQTAVRMVQFETSPLVAPLPEGRQSDSLGQVGPFPQPTAETAEDGFFQDTSTAYNDECPDPKSLPKISELSYKVVSPPGLFPESCPLPDEVYVRKAPTPITYTWKASNLCHKPLYFEDVQLERYGHTCCVPILQPVLSRVRFWLTIPVLPYFMGVYPPNECIYELGYYRPGSCAPHMLQPIPISLRGGLFQAGATVGTVFLIP